MLRYTKALVFGLAVAVRLTFTISSSQSIGLCLAHPFALTVPFQLLQSKSTYAHPFVEVGSVNPGDLWGSGDAS
jgi:hypothetical protein